MTYRQPIRIETYYDSETGMYYERPIYSPEDIAEGNALLEKILQGAEENNVDPAYYMMEFM
jgi:hypothetical protein